VRQRRDDGYRTEKEGAEKVETQKMGAAWVHAVGEHNVIEE
jgi:hypothetical protein